MKRWIIVGTALSRAFTLNACGGKSGRAEEAQRQESGYSEEQDEKRESGKSEFPEEAKEEQQPEEAKEEQQAEEPSAAAEDALLIGAWDDDNFRESLVLQDDGRFITSDEEKAVSGVWQVEGENIILVVDEADAVKYELDESEREENCPYHIEGDTLSLEPGGGERETFIRVEAAFYVPAGE